MHKGLFATLHPGLKVITLSGMLCKISGVILFMLIPLNNLIAQISPGDLSDPHSHLEGISNCTQCHVLGDKVTNEKCLKCHTDIQQRISLRKGYHSSADARGKPCITCHSDHHGRTFQLIRLDITKFDHNLTGYPLSVPHAKIECRDCHNSKYISDPGLKARKNTWLGTGTACLDCHADYHRKTLSPDCLSCHIANTFTPASRFNHAASKFQLLGKHKDVACLKCHKISMTDGKKFQQFKDVPYANCTSCHKDPHQNRFGQNCRQCHNEQSFQVLKVMNNFDHNKTNFRLEEKHVLVDCRACHKNRYTDPLKYGQCVDCHKDYHNRQFEKNGKSPDCSQCHSVKGFEQFSYSIEEHNRSTFPLRGSHLAIPCNDCHKKPDKWSFREIGKDCSDCHKDIHQPFIQSKYYPDANCRVCHTESQWSKVSFDHARTGFTLSGGHARQECRACHISRDTNGNISQKFSGLSMNCSDCHLDTHSGQFEVNGSTDCGRCHTVTDWKASRFDHNKTNFRLDGKHTNVPCASCHKPQQQGTTVVTMYKLKEFKCESCHF